MLEVGDLDDIYFIPQNFGSRMHLHITHVTLANASINDQTLAVSKRGINLQVRLK